jgi:hypothetical protein
MEKTTQLGASWSALLNKYNSSNQIKESKRGGHVARVGRRGGATGFRWGNLKKKRRDLSLEGRIILKWNF